MKKLIIIISILLSYGCMTKESIKSGITTNHDPYIKSTCITAPSIPVSQALQGYEEVKKMSIKDRFVKGWSASHSHTLRLAYFTNFKKYSLWIHFSDKNWKFFDSAYDIHGNKLELRGIDRDVNGGVKHGVIFPVSISESFSIPMSKKYLKEHSESGIKIKLYGSRGTLEVNVPSFYIKAFLEATIEKKTMIKTEWTCPLDSKPLYDNGHKLVCEHGHEYDRP